MAKLRHHLLAIGLISISLINTETFGSPIAPLTGPSSLDRLSHPPKMEGSIETPAEEDLSAVLEEELLQQGQDHHDGGGYDEEEEETDCPSGKWWHIRGQRCVPYVCVGGNRYRDAATGECLISKSFGQFSNSGGERSLSRYNPRMSMGKANKGRLRFGLPTKVKG